VILLLMLALGVYPSPFIKVVQGAGIEPQTFAPSLAAQSR
jgi:hypothetical protein